MIIIMIINQDDRTSVITELFADCASREWNSVIWWPVAKILSKNLVLMVIIVVMVIIMLIIVIIVVMVIIVMMVIIVVMVVIMLIIVIIVVMMMVIIVIIGPFNYIPTSQCQPGERPPRGGCRGSTG